MHTVGFLHTSPVHVATFDALVAELAPSWRVEHVVDESLLTMARADDEAGVASRLRTELQRLRDVGVDRVVCTCSTIGGLAEVLGTEIGLPVMRVDRPMIERAVASGSRIAVVAAIESTVGPTVALIDEVAEWAGVDVAVDVRVVPGAWDQFEAGDLDGYHRSIADALPDVAADADVIVLAQASMAPGVDRAGPVGVPVLASPRVAVEQLLVE